MIAVGAGIPVGVSLGLRFPEWAGPFGRASRPAGLAGTDRLRKGGREGGHGRSGRQTDRQGLLTRRGVGKIESMLSSPSDTRMNDRLAGKPAEVSSVRSSAPRLTQRGLTVLLLGMCLIPAVTICVLWSYLPRVYEGELRANAWTEDLPPAEFYELPFGQRQRVHKGSVHICNESDQVWTMLNVQINHFYQIYDRDELLPGQTRAYELKKFVTRTGAAFDLRYNPVRNVRIYARRPTKDRATYFKDFEAIDSN